MRLGKPYYWREQSTNDLLSQVSLVQLDLGLVQGVVRRHAPLDFPKQWNRQQKTH
jgi:hypothetical protein